MLSPVEEYYAGFVEMHGISEEDSPRQEPKNPSACFKQDEAGEKGLPQESKAGTMVCCGIKILCLLLIMVWMVMGWKWEGDTAIYRIGFDPAAYR